MSSLGWSHRVRGSDTDERLVHFYRMGQVSAVSLLVVLLLSGVAYVLWPYLPGSAPVPAVLVTIDADPLAAFFGLDGLLVLGNVLGVLLFVALYASFRRTHEAFALLALVLGVMGVVLILPARPIPELVALSHQYAAAATDAEQMRYVSAAEATIAQFDGAAFRGSTFLGSLSLLISSFLMLRTSEFGRATAYVGIATNLAVCGFLLPRIGTALLFLSVPGYLIWNAQLAWRFSRLVRQAGGSPVRQTEERPN